MSKHRVDLTGQRFGRLTIIEYHDTRHGHARWKCVCDCGTEKIVFGSSLRNGDSQSCGCLLADFNKSQVIHGREPRRLHRIWAGMKCRCNDPRNKDYKRYGGRGITVCSEWCEFVPFRDWALANGYAEDLTLDRIDVDGNYCPENCRWVSAKKQANNRTNNHKVSYNGETKNISEWAEHFNIDVPVLHAAIRRGRKMEEIVRKYAGNQPLREGIRE